MTLMFCEAAQSAVAAARRCKPANLIETLDLSISERPRRTRADKPILTAIGDD
jgi:hypothetical protein